MLKRVGLGILIALAVYWVAALLFLNFNQLFTLKDYSQFRFVWDFRYINLFPKPQQVVFMISAFVFVLFLLTGIGSSIRKTKYEKQNYKRLLSTWERKRGTVRVQYDDEGNITRRTLECAYDHFFAPVTRFQNKIATSLLLPENKKWNTPLINKIPIEALMPLEEIPEDKKGTEAVIHHTSGIPVVAYRKYFLFGKFNRVNYIHNVIHAMFIGSTGRGKGDSYVKTMIQANIDACESLLVHDPKRELLNTFETTLKEKGYKVVVLDFTKPDYSDAWNPLEYPYQRWKKEKTRYDHELELIMNDNSLSDMQKKERINNVKEPNYSESIEMALDIAQNICWEEDAQSPIWWTGAANTIAGLILFLFEEGIDEYVNFKSVKYLFQIGEDINNSIKKRSLLEAYVREFRDVDSESRAKLSTYFSSESVTRASFKATFESKSQILNATPDVTRMISNNTFSMTELFDQKTAVFLITHDEKSTYYPLVTMFIKQLYECLIKWTRDNNVTKVKYRFNWYLDEMGLLPEIKDIEAVYAAARSRGVRLFAFFQTFAQLQDKYEDKIARTMLDNNTHIIYLGSKEPEVAEQFSKMAGKELFYSKRERKFIERDVITKERLEQFERGRALLTAVEWNPYIVKLPPYGRYVFAKEEKFTSKEIKKDSPTFINIKEFYNNRTKNTPSFAEVDLSDELIEEDNSDVIKEVLSGFADITSISNI